MTGKAPAGGFDFQSRLVALVSVHIIAERPLSWTQFVDSDVPVAVSAETGGPGDDIRVEFTHGKMAYECQAKRTLNADSRLDDAMDDFAAGLPEQPSDRGILLVNPTSSGTIKQQLRTGLDLWRQGVGRGEPQGPLVRALGRLRARDAEAVAERLYVLEMDVEQDASPVAQLAMSILEKLLDDTNQSAAAWGVLIADGLRVCREGGRRDGESLRALLGHANIRLAQSGQGVSSQLARVNDNLDALRASLVSLSPVTIPPTPPPAETDRFSIQLDAAKELLNERRAEAALDLLRVVSGNTADASTPTRLRLHNLKGAALLRLDRHSEARDELLQALAIDATDKTALANIAHAELLDGRTSEALAYADKLLALDPVSIPAWIVVLQSRDSVEIPVALRDSPDILSTLAFLSLRAGHYDLAISYSRRALTSGFEPARALLLAQALYGLAFESDTPERYGNELEESRLLAGRISEELSTRQEPTLLERALITKGQAARLQGNEEAAEADFAHAQEVAPGSPQAAYMLALSYLDRGRPDGALFVIERAGNLKDHPLLLAMKARALLDLKRVVDAGVALSEAAEHNVGKSASLDVTLMIIELAIHGGFADFADLQLARLPREAGWMRHLLRARLAIQQSKDTEVRSSFETAIQEAGLHEQPRVRAEFADYLRRSGEPERAVEVLAAAGAEDRPLLRSLYARALLDAGRFSVASRLLDRVKAESSKLPTWALRTGAEVALASDDLPKAVNYLQDLRTRLPHDAEVRIKLAHELLRSHESVSALAVLDELRVNESLTSRELIQTAELYIRAEHPEHALPLAYMALRLDPDAADVQLAYINIFLRREHEQSGLDVSVVGRNTYVGLHLDDGEKTGYFIVGSGEPNRQALEIAPSDALAEQLLGKTLGDSIRLRQGAATERVATIAEIKSHFVHAFQDILLHFPQRHPDNAHLQAFKVPENPTPEDFGVISDMAKARQESTDQILDLYAEHGLPLGVIATVTGTSIANAYWLLATNAKYPLLVEFSDAYDAARSAAGSAQSIVVTRSALVTGLQLGLLGIVAGLGLDLRIPRSLVDELDEERRELVDRSKRGYLAIRSTEHGPVPQEIAAEAYKVELERFDKMRGWVDQYCSVQPRHLSTIGPEHNKRRGAFGDSSYDSLSLVRTGGGQLFADDLGLRRLLLAENLGPGFSTYALLGALLERKIIEAVTHDEYVAQLLLLNHETLLVTPRIYRMALERQDFNPRGRLLRLLERLHAPDIGVAQVVSFSVGLLREVATTSGGRDHLPEITLTLADLVVAKGMDERVVNLLGMAVQRAFSLLPLEKDVVIGCLERYSQAKFRRE